MKTFSNNNPLVLITLLLSVYLQILLYGTWLWDATFCHLGIAYSVMVMTGLISVFFTGTICRLVFGKTGTLPIWAQPVLEKQAAQLSLRSPAIFLSASSGINAFAVAGPFRNGVLVLQKEIFQQLTQDEVEAVFAHELAHIRQGHAMVLTLLQAICVLPVLLPIMLAAGLLALIYDLQRYRTIFIFLQGILILLAFPLTGILVAFVTRYWEYEADKIAAELTGYDKYIAALRCLHGSFFQHPNLLGASAMVKSQRNREGWALSHPGLMQRINALRDNG